MEQQEVTVGATEATPPERKPSALERASRVANAVHLENVRFVQFSGHGLGAAPASRGLELVPTVGFTRPRISREDRLILVSSTLICSVAAAQQPDPPVGPLASMRATIELTYREKDDSSVDDDDVREFANVNVPFNSWGYWREYVQSTLARLGFTSGVILPLFRVQVAKSWMLDDEG